MATKQIPTQVTEIKSVEVCDVCEKPTDDGEMHWRARHAHRRYPFNGENLEHVFCSLECFKKFVDKITYE